MKKLLILLLLFTLTPARADVSPGSGIPSLTVGGRVFTDLSSNLIVLWATITASAAVKHSSLRKIGTTAGYTVTSGKTLTVQGCRFLVKTAAAGISLVFAYGDTDVSMNGAAPTNETDSTGNAGFGHLIGIINPASTAQVDAPFWDTVPTGKIPEVYNSTGTIDVMVYCFGYEK
jgi:hypothetical protein